MRLLVLGGSGFLGGYVLREAARAGHQVLALTRSPAAARAVAALGAEPLTGDLDDSPRLGEAFAAARGEVLVCLASLGFGHGPAIVSAAEAAGIPRAVFVSTTAVTTTLHPPTKQVRLAAEERIRRCGLDWTILRPTMIYGDAGDRNLSRLLRLLKRAPVLPVPAPARACTSRSTWPMWPPLCWPRRSGPPRSARSTTWPGPSRSRSPSCCGPVPARSGAAPACCPSRSRRWLRWPGATNG